MTTYNRTSYTHNESVDPRAQGASTDQRSMGDLFSELTANTSLLARQEFQLAKVEMQDKARNAAGDIAIVALGAALGNAALLALVAAAVLGLSLYMDAWLAALLVAIVVGVIAAILISVGLSALKEIDPIPEQSVESLREDKEWLTRQMS